MQTAAAQVLVALCAQLGMARPKKEGAQILCAEQSVL